MLSQAQAKVLMPPERPAWRVRGGRSCVPGIAPAVQALEMGLPEDPVDLVVGDQA